MKRTCSLLVHLLLLASLLAESQRAVANQSSGDRPRVRTALVIGNSRYKQLQPLEACRHDAEMMAQTFQKIGIALHGGKPLFDLTSDEMDAAIAAFARSLDRESEAFLYFTGHGAQIGGSNYLLPVNFDAQYENQARRQAISLDSILETLEKTDSRLRVVILDACRNAGDFLPGEPKSKSTARSKGLQEPRVDAPETLVCFATKHGTEALADEKASFYSRVLAEEMVKPRRIEDVLREVAKRVLKDTGQRQRPFTYGSLLQDHFFVTAPAAVPAPPRPAEPPAGTATAPAPAPAPELAFSAPPKVHSVPGRVNISDPEPAPVVMESEKTASLSNPRASSTFNLPPVSTPAMIPEERPPAPQPKLTKWQKMGVKSVWNHNGSRIGLIVNGSQRSLVYMTVSSEMNRHVSSGDMLFEGSVNGGELSGNARRFKKGFSPINYSVQGQLAQNSSSFQLHGLAPKRDAKGQVTEYVSDVMRFDLIESLD